jgi:hypothetical protein
MYQALDWFFIVFHSLLIIFNLFGWIWRPLRKANLITLLLTGFSWIGLGVFYGMGYCPLTDWHWEVLNILGQSPNTNSYVAYIFQRVLGISVTNSFADKLTLIAYLVTLALSVTLNLRDWFRSRL